MSNSRTKTTKADASGIKDSIAHSQEETRTWLAKAIFWALIIILIVVVALSVYKDKEYFLLFDSVISGIIGLLGIIIGFYFGSKQN